jgi:hypothetical protein
VARLVYQNAVEELIPLTISRMACVAKQQVQGASAAALSHVLG